MTDEPQEKAQHILSGRWFHQVDSSIFADDPKEYKKMIDFSSLKRVRKEMNKEYTDIEGILDTSTLEEMEKLKDLYLKRRLKLLEKKLEVFKDSDVLQSLMNRIGERKP